MSGPETGNPWRDPELAGEIVRGAVQNIYRLARGIRDGTRVPAQALNELGATADVSRPRRDGGTLLPFESAPFWPVYSPFHELRLRWASLQARGELTAELADALQVEIYEAAYALLGESRSHRPTRALVMYERGRLRADSPEAVGMARFIIGHSSGLSDRET